MDHETVTLETPFAKRKVVLKQWITGRERQYINEPMLGAIDMSPKTMGKHTSMEMGKIDIKTLFTESTNREIEKFVVSVDDQTANILDLVLDMHEEDMQFVLDEIKSRGPKKKGVESETL